jgi:acetolactate synthase small subunit
MDLMRGFGIAEMAKTGIVALSRGAKPQAERAAEKP